MKCFEHLRITSTVLFLMYQQANGRAVLQANMTLKAQGTNDNNILQNIFKIVVPGLRLSSKRCFKPY